MIFQLSVVTGAAVNTNHIKQTKYCLVTWDLKLVDARNLEQSDSAPHHVVKKKKKKKHHVYLF